MNDEEKDNREEQLHVNFEDNCADLKITIDIYRRILSKALDQTKSDLQDISTAVSGSDFEKIREISHRLKGD